jgi:hypothetical protein
MNDQIEDHPGESKLRLKPRLEQSRPPVRAAPPAKKKKSKAPKTPKAGKASGRFGMRFLGMSIGSFLLGSALLGSFLYHQATGMEILTEDQAEMTRGVAVVAFLVILIIEAFTEDLLQGVLSLFLLPYAFVYGLLFADAGPIRGFTMAMLVFLGAEMYFTPQNALVPKVTNTINEWIDLGQQLIWGSKS